MCCKLERTYTDEVNTIMYTEKKTEILIYFITKLSDTASTIPYEHKHLFKKGHTITLQFHGKKKIFIQQIFSEKISLFMNT